MSTQSNILITGAAGFIGSHLCDFFLGKGHVVTGLDNLSTGFEKNINHLFNHPNFTFKEGDIRDLETCKKAIVGCDFVSHQAALGSVPRSIIDPVLTNEVNVGGFLNMLVACKDAGVKKMVYAASSSTYGDSSTLPKREDVIGKPLSPYAVTKFVNELYADVFFKTYGFHTIGLRYFNVFGPRQDPNGAYAAVIPKFVKQMMNEKPIVINGNGSFSRDFTFIENVVQANALALFTKNKEASNTVYNVACGDRTTLNELVILLKEAMLKIKPSLQIPSPVYGPERIGDVPHSEASIEKAINLLGYDAKYNVKDGIEQSVQWYIKNL